MKLHARRLDITDFIPASVSCTRELGGSDGDLWGAVREHALADAATTRVGW